MDDIYKNIEEKNPNKKLIALDDTIADMLSDEKFKPIVTELLEVEN